MCHRRQNEEGDEYAYPAIGDQRAGEHDRQHRAARSQTLGHAFRYGGNRAAVIHQLAEQRAEQEQRKELRDELRRAAHEGLRPIGQQRLARDRGCKQCGRRRQQQYAPAPGRPATSAGRVPARCQQGPCSALRQQRIEAGGLASARCRRRAHRGRHSWRAGPHLAAFSRKARSAFIFDEEPSSAISSRQGSRWYAFRPATAFAGTRIGHLAEQRDHAQLLHQRGVEGHLVRRLRISFAVRGMPGRSRGLICTRIVSCALLSRISGVIVGLPA